MNIQAKFLTSPTPSNQTNSTPNHNIENDEIIIDDFGNRKWLLDGLLHRTDGPAIDCRNGKTEWWRNGLRHRIDGPAMTWPNGKSEYWVNGRLHRPDGPAIIYEDETYEWWLDGKQLDEDLYRIKQFFNGFIVARFD